MITVAVTMMASMKRIVKLMLAALATPTVQVTLQAKSTRKRVYANPKPQTFLSTHA
jgi:hypothetical protein